MENYPCHPFEPKLGGIKVMPCSDDQVNVAVFDPFTDEPAMWATVPADLLAGEDLAISPTLVLTRQILFDLFPNQTWYIGRPWEGEAPFRITGRSDRKVSGTVTVDEVPLPWIGELAHSAGGRVWRYALGAWPPSVHRLDVVFLGRVLEIIHGMNTEGADDREQVLDNRFQGSGLPYTHVPFRVVKADNIWVLYGRRTGEV